MTTVQDDIRDVKAACALLGYHAEAIVDHHRNVAETLRGLARRLRNAGMAPPPSATPVAPPLPATPAPAPVANSAVDRLSTAPRVPEPVTLFSDAEVAGIYARRKSDVQRHRDGGSDPKAQHVALLPPSVPATDSLDPAAIYERRRQAVAASGSR
jgi:hypothetical protein